MEIRHARFRQLCLLGLTGSDQLDLHEQTCRICVNGEIALEAISYLIAYIAPARMGKQTPPRVQQHEKVCGSFIHFAQRHDDLSRALVAGIRLSEAAMTHEKLVRDFFSQHAKSPLPNGKDAFSVH
ncbi:hypothetical protein, partial [Mesorhizobium sp. M2A.F.Ca.ET.067.02.1.1]|uniref:hypothetical protein n=1 Tax=Mesorhizobium sp. M2A.F.Ca.ET.067.02.1.1 TaxID=2496749 RepID=UPI001AEC83AB